MPSVVAYERKDAYYRRAKSEGFRSRAAYKLLEIDRRLKILRRGDRVVDLGSWPGGWLQVAAAAVGPGGRVVGIDLVAVDPLPEAWVTLFCADLADENVQARIGAALGGPADVVLSDMAPKLSGIRARDEARASELVHLALGFARRHLRPGGRFLVKLFDGPESNQLLAELRKSFGKVKGIRPEATRRGSAELYADCSDYRAGAAD